MYVDIIKKKKVITYIILFSFLVVFLLINIVSSIENFDKKEIEKLELLLKKEKLNHVELKITLDDIVKKNLEIFRKSINTNDLRNNLTSLCDTLVKNEILSNCQVTNIISPFEYSNVAKFTLSSFNQVDKLIMKRLIEQIYYIKKTTESDLGVEFEVYNKY